jgi:hypothetical protein
VRWIVDASSVVAYLLGEGSDAEREGMLGDVHTNSLMSRSPRPGRARPRL